MNILFCPITNCSAGGTPYCGLRTREVKSRILQGLRLPQTRYTSDILYQLMLTCWMTDPSERPDFSTVLDSFSDMVTSQQVKNELISQHCRRTFKCTFILKGMSKSHNVALLDKITNFSRYLMPALCLSASKITSSITSRKKSFTEKI